MQFNVDLRDGIYARQKGIFLNDCYVAYCLRTSPMELFGAYEHQHTALKAVNFLILVDEQPLPTLNYRVFTSPKRASAIFASPGQLPGNGS
ncbi:hypothetical protein A1353_14745 [Methylomonas methanica]|uniref:Uncharacterized protein n=1 Tax=Methylomonas methanica TaxID=421 RepID=A0A177MBK2_METMH|nr:hypothetical protein A1353_14745 [Methylomonas methanica]